MKFLFFLVSIAFLSTAFGGPNGKGSKCLSPKVSDMYKHPQKGYWIHVDKVVDVQVIRLMKRRSQAPRILDMTARQGHMFRPFVVSIRYKKNRKTGKVERSVMLLPSKVFDQKVCQSGYKFMGYSLKDGEPAEFRKLAVNIRENYEGLAYRWFFDNQDLYRDALKRIGVKKKAISKSGTDSNSYHGQRRMIRSNDRGSFGTGKNTQQRGMGRRIRRVSTQSRSYSRPVSSISHSYKPDTRPYNKRKNNNNDDNTEYYEGQRMPMR
jgi:hypothetical protein